MTGEGPPTAVWPRLALAAACAVLLVFSALHQLHDSRGRADVERFFSGFTLDLRRPEMLATARVEGTADLAMAVAARAATLDVIGRTPLAGLEPELRDVWLQSVRALPEEVAAARTLALDAIAARPAWAFHALGLAELVLSDEWREPAESRRREKWLTPLRVASAWAPSAPGIRALWAAAAVDRWAALSSEERREARVALREALKDEGFQRLELGPVVATLGASDGLSLIPETPAALGVARRVLEKTAPFEVRLGLESRWTAAEREERRCAVREIAMQLEHERGDRAVQLAFSFLKDHPVELFDDTEGREQARVVLQAVGDGRPGGWQTDARGRLVRYFLANPLRPGPAGEFLSRASNGLEGIPEGTRALLLLYAADEFGWRREVAQANTLGSSEWTPFFVELARRSLALGASAEAELALSKVTRFDLGQCDALLVRRDIARARERGFELADLSAVWPAAFPLTLEVPGWPASGAGTLALCVDPERDGRSSLFVTVSSSEPVLAWWGWDGGREGTVQLETEKPQTLELPLAGLRGRRTFSLGPLLGPGLRLTQARIDSAGVGPAPVRPSDSR